MSKNELEQVEEKILSFQKEIKNLRRVCIFLLISQAALVISQAAVIFWE